MDPHGNEPVIYYVINLDRSADRWTYMREMCAARGLEAERVPAVDGRAYAPGQTESLAPPAPGMRLLAATEIACFESHRRAWQRIADGPDEWGAVLEDDVCLADGIGEICEAIIGTVTDSGHDLELVKLNNYLKPIYLQAMPLARVGGRVAIHRVMQPTIDASAYLMSRAAARRALDHHARIRDQLDIALFDPAGGLAIAQTVPALSVQEKFADFTFLPGAASASLIEAARADASAQIRSARPARGPGTRLAAELRRFYRRRIEPKAIAVTNLLRPPDRRIIHQRVRFAGR